MKDLLKRRYEAWQVMKAAKILKDRNVTRSMVVSRRDNNDMYYMAEKLEGIAKRMCEKYENV